MPALAAVTLVNNAAANVVFTPRKIDSDGVAHFFAADAGANGGFDVARRLTHQVVLPKNGSSVIRVKQRVVVPTQDITDPGVKTGESYVNVEFVLDKKALPETCLDLRKFADTLIMHAITLAAVSNKESVY